MPICTPCHPEHTAAQCEDTLHDRTGVGRRCYCQHKPRTTTPTGQATPSPECEIPTDVAATIPTVGVGGHTEP